MRFRQKETHSRGWGEGEGTSSVRGVRKAPEEWLLNSCSKKEIQEIIDFQVPLRGQGRKNALDCGTQIKDSGTKAGG